MDETSIQIQDSGLRIKVPCLQVDDQDVPVGGPFLDCVTKMDISGGVVIRVESLIGFDGISLRKLDPRVVRNTATLRGSGKVSMKQTHHAVTKASQEAIDLVLQTTGFSLFHPLFRLVQLTRKKVGKRSPDDRMTFRGVMHNREIGPIGTVRTSIAKFHTLTRDSLRGFGEDDIVGKPALHILSKISLRSGVTGGLHMRHNIPLFGLSRDHAKDVIITAHTSVSRILENSIEMPLFDGSSQLHVGKFIYHTVQSSSSE